MMRSKLAHRKSVTNQSIVILLVLALLMTMAWADSGNNHDDSHDDSSDSHDDSSDSHGPDSNNDSDSKVTLCHKPGENEKTKEVDSEDVETHLNHGDRLGTCEISFTLSDGSSDLDVLLPRIYDTDTGVEVTSPTINQVYDVEVDIQPTVSRKVSKITFHDLNVSSNLSIDINDINTTASGSGAGFDNVFSDMFAIDPSTLNFTNATVTATASGRSLFKCEDWNFSTETCPSGKWKKMSTLTPGQDYNFTITPLDPGFGESNQFLDVLDHEGYLINSSQEVVVNNSGVLDLFINISNSSVSSVLLRSFDDLTPHELKIDDNVTMNARAYSIDPTGINFTNATITVTATGNHLYKCASWNFTTKNCTDGNWSFIQTVTPGVTYQFLVSALDPAYSEVNQPSAGIGKDSHLMDDNPTNTEGTDTEMAVAPESGALRNALLEFDLSNIPSSATVWSAVLELYQTDGKGISFDIDVHRITAVWAEMQVTWDDRVSGTSWSSGGGDYAGTVYASETVSSTNEWKTWNITALVQEWFAGTYLNYGMILVPSSSENDKKKFASSDHATTSWHPKLTVDYTVPGASVTNLDNPSSGMTWIYWNWTNPGDSDFNHVEVWINGTFYANVSAPDNFYNATSLTFDTTYEIQTRTVTDTGDVNQTWVNDAGVTLPDTTDPVVNSISDTPDPVNQSLNITISANVTDDIDVDSVWVDIEGTNYSMVKNVGNSTILDATFESDAEGFVYQDDLYQSTNKPSEESGSRVTDANCSSGSCLQIQLNTNPSAVGPWSGGWDRTFTLSSTGQVNISFNYTIRIDEMTETGEFTRLYYRDLTDSSDVLGDSIQGSGFGGTDGVYDSKSGSILYSVNLTSGNHTFDVGCYLTDVSTTSEDGDCFIDDVLISSASSSVLWELSHNTSLESGLVSYTVYANDTSSNDATSVTGNYTVTPSDAVGPTWSNNGSTPPTPATYSPGANYQFNVAWTDISDVDNVFMEHNFTGTLTNYSITGNSSSEYFYNYSDLAVGSYVWRMFANDTLNYTNQTDQWVYVVVKAGTWAAVYLDGSDDNLTVTYLTTTNATAFTSAGTIALYRNGTPVSNPEVTSLPVGVYNYTGINPGNDNYTGSSDTWYLIVTDILPPTISIVDPQQITYGYSLGVPLNYNVADDVVLDSCWYSINGGTNTTISGCLNTTINTTVYANTLTIYANDTAGNLNQSSVQFNTTLNATLFMNESQDPVSNGVLFKLISDYEYANGTDILDAVCTNHVLNTTDVGYYDSSLDVVENITVDVWHAVKYENMGANFVLENYTLEFHLSSEGNVSDKDLKIWVVKNASTWNTSMTPSVVLNGTSYPQINGTVQDIFVSLSDTIFATAGNYTMIFGCPDCNSTDRYMVGRDNDNFGHSYEVVLPDPVWANFYLELYEAMVELIVTPKLLNMTYSASDSAYVQILMQYISKETSKDYTWNGTCTKINHTSRTDLAVYTVANNYIPRPNITSVSPDPAEFGTDVNVSWTNDYTGLSFAITSSYVNLSDPNGTFVNQYQGASFMIPSADIAFAGIYTLMAYAGNDAGSNSSSTNFTVQDTVFVNITIISVDGDTESFYWDTSNNSQTLLSVDAEPNALCRWGASDANYSTMSNTCTMSNGTANCNLGNVTQINQTTRYVSCRDQNGNENNASNNLDVVFGVDYTSPTTYDDYDGSTALPGLNVTISETDIPANTTVLTWYCDTSNNCTPVTAIDDNESITFTTRGTNYLRYYSADSANNTQSTKTTVVLVNSFTVIGSTSFADGPGNEFNASITPTDVDSLQNISCDLWYRLNGTASNFSNKSMSGSATMAAMIGTTDGYSTLDVIETYISCYDGLETINTSNSTQTHEVPRIVSACTLSFSPVSPVMYGTSTNASCSCDNLESSAELWRNGTNVTATENNQNTALTADVWSYVCNVSESQNYTDASDTSTYTVLKGNSVVNLRLNGTDGSISVERLVNVEHRGDLLLGESNFMELYRNGTLIASGTSPLINNSAYTTPGYYNITLSYPETANYNPSSETHFITVNDTDPPGTVLGLNDSIDGETWIYWTWTNPSDDDFDHVELWLNGTFMTNSSGSSYNATNLTGNVQYELQTRTADSYGNINLTWVNDTGIPVDITAPDVVILSPVQGSQNYTDTIIFISVNASDEDPVSSMQANISWLGGALTETINLSDPDLDEVFEGNFTNTTASGVYVITIIAEDSHNNVNDTETVSTTLFHTADTSTDFSVYSVSTSVSITGTYFGVNSTVDLDIRYPNGTSVSGYPTNASTTAQGVFTDTWSIPANATLGNYTIISSDNNNTLLFSNTTFEVIAARTITFEVLDTTGTHTDFPIFFYDPDGTLDNVCLSPCNYTMDYGVSKKIVITPDSALNTVTFYEFNTPQDDTYRVYVGDPNESVERPDNIRNWSSIISLGADFANYDEFELVIEHQDGNGVYGCSDWDMTGDSCEGYWMRVQSTPDEPRNTTIKLSNIFLDLNSSFGIGDEIITFKRLEFAFMSPGIEYVMNIRVFNQIDYTLTNTTVVETIPDDWFTRLGSVISVGQNGTFNATDNTITWDLGSLDSKDSEILSYRTRAPILYGDETSWFAYPLNATTTYVDQGTNKSVTDIGGVTIKQTASISLALEPVQADAQQSTSLTINLTNVGDTGLASGANLTVDVPSACSVTAVANGSVSSGVVTWTNISSIATNQTRQVGFTASCSYWSLFALSAELSGQDVNTIPIQSSHELLLEVVDDTLPTITTPQVVPSPAEKEEPITIGATVTDDISLNQIIATIMYPNGTGVNSSMSLTTGDVYQTIFDDLSVTGVYTYTIYAQDKAFNTVTTTPQGFTTFEVNPAIITLVYPLNNSIIGGNPTYLNVTTNKNAVCEYALSTSFTFGMGTQFTTTGAKTHGASLGNLTTGVYTYAVKCNTTAGLINDNTDQAVTTFTFLGTPPNGITDLGTTGLRDRWITWNWTNPASSPFFNHTEIWVNGTFRVNVTDPTNYVNVTWLEPSTTYEIQTRTVDHAGNVNTTWVNHNASTIQDVFAPIITATSPVNKTAFSTGTSWTTVEVQTDELSSCKYAVSDSAWGSMSAITNNNGTHHNILTYGLTDGTTYNLYFLCEDFESSANRMTSSYHLQFSIGAATTTTPSRSGGGGGGSAVVCRDEWRCTEWSDCSPDGNQIRKCLLVRDCRLEETIAPTQEKSCIYDGGVERYGSSRASTYELGNETYERFDGHCYDGIHNFDEVDIDCGGVGCPPCTQVDITGLATARSILSSKLPRILIPFIIILLILIAILWSDRDPTAKQPREESKHDRFALTPRERYVPVESRNPPPPSRTMVRSRQQTKTAEIFRGTQFVKPTNMDRLKELIRRKAPSIPEPEKSEMPVKRSHPLKDQWSVNQKKGMKNVLKATRKDFMKISDILSIHDMLSRRGMPEREIVAVETMLQKTPAQQRKGIIRSLKSLYGSHRARVPRSKSKRAVHRTSPRPRSQKPKSKNSRPQHTGPSINQVIADQGAVVLVMPSSKKGRADMLKRLKGMYK